MQRSLTAVLLLANLACAQNFLYLPASLSPNTVELPSYNLRPFMQTNSRVQMFFSAAETGSSSFTASALSLRYDGPIPQVGAPGPFTVQRLRIQGQNAHVKLLKNCSRIMHADAASASLAPEASASVVL